MIASPPVSGATRLTDAQQRKLLIWLLQDVSADTGQSSKTIAAMALGVKYRHTNIPHDGLDFNRCAKLVRRIPQLRRVLPLVARAYPQWRPFVEQWDVLIVEWKAAVKENTSQSWAVFHARIRELRKATA